MTITPDQARELLDGATPGPWVKRRDRDGDPLPVVVSTPRGDRHHIMTAEPACSEERAQADTGLIAAAPDLAQTIAGMTEEWGVKLPATGKIMWRSDLKDARELAELGNGLLVRRLVSDPEVIDGE